MIRLNLHLHVQIYSLYLWRIAWPSQKTAQTLTNLYRVLKCLESLRGFKVSWPNEAQRPLFLSLRRRSRHGPEMEFQSTHATCGGFGKFQS